MREISRIGVLLGYAVKLLKNMLLEQECAYLGQDECRAGQFDIYLFGKFDYLYRIPVIGFL